MFCSKLVGLYRALFDWATERDFMTRCFFGDHVYVDLIILDATNRTGDILVMGSPAQTLGTFGVAQADYHFVPRNE